MQGRIKQGVKNLCYTQTFIMPDHMHMIMTVNGDIRPFGTGRIIGQPGIVNENSAAGVEHGVIDFRVAIPEIGPGHMNVTLAIDS